MLSSPLAHPTTRAFDNWAGSSQLITEALCDPWAKKSSCTLISRRTGGSSVVHDVDVAHCAMKIDLAVHIDVFQLPAKTLLISARSGAMMRAPAQHPARAHVTSTSNITFDQARGARGVKAEPIAARAARAPRPAGGARGIGLWSVDFFDWLSPEIGGSRFAVICLL